jgi:hypothetical protein
MDKVGLRCEMKTRRDHCTPVCGTYQRDIPFHGRRRLRDFRTRLCDCARLALPRSSVDFRLQMRDSIQLRNPDGQIVDTYIAGIELLCGPEVKDRMVSLLPQNVRKRDAPNGTEIWLIRER